MAARETAVETTEQRTLTSEKKLERNLPAIAKATGAVIGDQTGESKVKKIVWREVFRGIFGLFFVSAKLSIQKGPNEIPEEFRESLDQQLFKLQVWNF